MNKFLSIIVFLTIGCSNPEPINGFDSRAWQADINGCLGSRSLLIDTLMAQKNKLIGEDQEYITSLFGKPNRHEIHKRSKQFFEYAISPTKDCAQFKKQNEQNLTLRFNSIGKLQEIIYYK